MLRTALLSVSPLDGSKLYYHFDDVTRKIYFETQLDVAAIVEQNLIERNETERHSRWGDGRRVARVPNLILNRLRRTNRGPERNPIEFYKWLEDHPAFKLRNGNLRGLVKNA